MQSANLYFDLINPLHNTDTIVAVATAPGVGAIAVIRLSGPEAITITNGVFKGKDLTKQASHTIHFGTIRDEDKIVDEVLVSLFVAPHSYTKENVVEISCHGSDYIVQQIVKLLLKHGARLANAGEFTKRAFLNGQFDLAQAEAVADLISSDSALSHEVAMKQMRGGFSQEIKRLRAELVHFASMIELELDFGEEDVEFADREQLRSLILNIQRIIRELLKSFELGNVIKNGVPTVIVGKPNAGNLIYKGTARNFNPMMATAGKITVAEVEELVPAGELDPNMIHTPGIFVQRIFQGEKYEKRIEQRTVRQA